MTERNGIAGQTEGGAAKARRLLLRQGLDGNDPRWSSEVLDRLLQSVLETPGGSVSDLVGALASLLGDFRTKLSGPVAGLIKDLVVLCFTRAPNSYASIDWTPLVGRLEADPTPAICYFAMHALPPQYLSRRLAETITRGLENTEFHQEAETTLAV